MPYRDDPDCLALDAIEQAVRGNDDFSIGKLGKFGKDATGARKPLEPTQHSFSSLSEPPSGNRIVANNIRDRVKELPAAGRREANLHRQASARRRSASARTSPRS